MAEMVVSKYQVRLFSMKLLKDINNTYIPLTLYPRREAEVSQIFLRDAHVLPNK
jgi:hypothetical protein